MGEFPVFAAAGFQKHVPGAILGNCKGEEVFCFTLAVQKHCGPVEREIVEREIYRLFLGLKLAQGVSSPGAAYKSSSKR